MALLVGLSAPIQPASAAYGLTNLVISNENPKSNDRIKNEKIMCKFCGTTTSGRISINAKSEPQVPGAMGDSPE